jgi:hypothetical protein
LPVAESLHSTHVLTESCLLFCFHQPLS